MSWSIEEHIGEGRPWPEQVVVYRGETDESLTYARRSLSDMNKMAELMDALATENAELRELCRDTNKAAHMLCEAWEGSCSKEAEGMSLHAVCPISDTSELCVFGKLYDRMRELGIEVDK